MKCIQLLIFILLFSAGYQKAHGQVEFRQDSDNNKVEVYIEDQLFTNFFYPDDLEKPVLYPIYTASGKDITRGYPYNPRPYERTDHPHHVGLWLNFGDVNGLDFWNNSFAVQPENKHRYGSIKFKEIINMDHQNGTLVVRSDWVDHDDSTLLSEETTFIFDANDGVRTIERTSELTAVRDVQLNGNKEGLLGLRVDRAFEEPAGSPQRLLDANGNPVDDRILNNEGLNGVYRNADGQTGSNVWGERSPWVALSAEKEGETITIAIFDHEENPYYPAWSHARGYGLFAVNNLGGRGMHDDAEEVQIDLKQDESIRFTHLIVIGGELTDRELEVFSNEFH